VNDGVAIRDVGGGEHFSPGERPRGDRGVLRWLCRRRLRRCAGRDEEQRGDAAAGRVKDVLRAERHRQRTSSTAVCDISSADFTAFELISYARCALIMSTISCTISTFEPSSCPWTRRPMPSSSGKPEVASPEAGVAAYAFCPIAMRPLGLAK